MENCLNKWSGSRDSYTPNVGIPQTSITSPLISNLLLHHIDEAIITSSLRYYRYIDDIRIYGYKIDEMEQVLVDLELMLKSINLTLNSSKTRIKKLKLMKI